MMLTTLLGCRCQPEDPRTDSGVKTANGYNSRRANFPASRHWDRTMSSEPVSPHQTGVSYALLCYKVSPSVQTYPFQLLHGYRTIITRCLPAQQRQALSDLVHIPGTLVVVGEGSQRRHEREHVGRVQLAVRRQLMPDVLLQARDLPPRTVYQNPSPRPDNET